MCVDVLLIGLFRFSGFVFLVLGHQAMDKVHKHNSIKSRAIDCSSKMAGGPLAFKVPYLFIYLFIHSFIHSFIHYSLCM